jgi:hypothetical protein
VRSQSRSVCKLQQKKWLFTQLKSHVGDHAPVSAERRHNRVPAISRGKAHRESSPSSQQRRVTGTGNSRDQAEAATMLKWRIQNSAET